MPVYAATDHFHDLVIESIEYRSRKRVGVIVNRFEFEDVRKFWTEQPYP